ncbi:TolC family protein [Mucilaginibacter antarcticus]|uniref:TolC family protein n=1 Tax=Mucilaginibacter antarcticus TaxID=1855725 RepID=UPI003642DA99
MQNAQLSTQIAKNNLSKTIIQAVLDLQSAEKQYQSATQTFEANKDALNVTKQRYDVGLVNSWIIIPRLPTLINRKTI